VRWLAIAESGLRGELVEIDEAEIPKIHYL
jgi:hypothetical protein